jgi:hypothetical protein
MQESSLETELTDLLAKFDACGGVLDFVFLDSGYPAPTEQLHHIAALDGIAAIDRRLEKWANSHATKEYPLEVFFRLEWNETKLKGHRVTLSEFWGSDDVEPKAITKDSWAIPNVDGYKTAFFLPPHVLSGTTDEMVQLFEKINEFVLGNTPEQIDIISWSTDWSNYFDAGHEWWGAFFWTIRRADSDQVVVIGASTTD